MCCLCECSWAREEFQFVVMLQGSMFLGAVPLEVADWARVTPCVQHRLQVSQPQTEPPVTESVL